MNVIRRLAIVVPVVVLTASTFGASTAFAAGPHTAPRTLVKVEEVPMQVVSSTSLGGSAKRISPYNTVTGNCGTSSVYIYDLTGGKAEIVFGAQSTIGLIYDVSFEVEFKNFTTDGSGFDSGSQAVALSTSWWDLWMPWTAPGEVEAWMPYLYAYVETPFGPTICVGKYPFDWTYITY